MNKKVILTGIKPTGEPHIGNYFGAIKPALSFAEEYEARYFIADYHALNSVKDARTLQTYTYEIAAAWLACGLDPEKVLFYRQSAVPETFELATLLCCFTPKGLMNRAHAYKAVVQKNAESDKDPDDGVNMGLFNYPVLMAADILLFDTALVPVGRDQFQHIEMTVDMAQAVNSNYGKPLFEIPRAMTTETTQTIVGLDGRKMSKSYHNTIPLFLPAKQLRKLLMKIVTNSQEVDEKKDPDSCNIFKLYQLFADNAQQETLREKYLAGGMGWGHAKQDLFEVVDAHLKPMREKYDEIIQDSAYIDRVLNEGAEKARHIARKKINRLRSAIGIVG